MNHATTSYPDAFLGRMQLLLGDEFPAFIESLGQPSPTSLRLNPKKRISKFDSEEKISWCEEGRYLAQRPSFTFDPLFHAGTYYVQEASSMFVEQVWKQVNPNKEAVKVLDMCAAPGGKSTHLLSLMDGKGVLVSNELLPHRNRILQQNIIKWGYPNCIITQNKAEDFAALENYFDLVLIDAPCSGEGLFRKDKEAIDEWSERNVAICAQRQKDILNSAYRCLKPGGFLIYSTCTFEAEENDENMKRLGVGSWEIAVEQPGITKTNYGYQFFPHKVKGEGFYISVFKKEGDWVPNFEVSAPSAQLQNPDFLQSPEDFAEIKKNDLFFAIPKTIHNDFLFLEKQLYIRNVGICMGTMKGKDFLPAHDLALSIAIGKDIPSVELNNEEAIAYLRGETPKIKSAYRGWCLATFEEKNLGWMKLMPNRWNNYYPKEYRILKQK
ncbi:MAG: RNA methyltransferase [Bacteroidetes bacterium]|nr:RNA methyltransferase [Bacteroidota bacterium]